MIVSGRLPDGGKRRLAGPICQQISSIPHRLYAEPFVGMGGVFLRRRLAAAVEVINGISGDVVTFFRILQRHYAPFMDELRYRFTSRAEFERLLATDPATCTDIERAVRFLYLQRTAFGGKVKGRNFGVSLSTPGRFDVLKLAEVLSALADRLAGVVIESLTWQVFIPRYDQRDTLFYLDPPYWGSEDYYGRDLFPKAAFEQLAELLSTIAGRLHQRLPADALDLRSVRDPERRPLLLDKRREAAGGIGADERLDHLSVSVSCKQESNSAYISKVCSSLRNDFRRRLAC